MNKRPANEKRQGQGGVSGNQLLSSVAVAAVAATAPVGHAYAQEGASETNRSDEIVVVARRVEESARDLPFSVTVLGGDTLSEQRLPTLEDALRFSPGVEVNSYGDSQQTSFRIRGVGSLQKVSSDDSSVAISVDGLPQSIANATLNMVDVERVEVLRGPQGTLFGRNSEAGAINIITRRPTDIFEGFVHAEGAEQNQYLVEGALSGPLAENLSGRMALRASGSDSQLINVRTGDPATKPRDYTGRLSLLWEPTSETDMFVSYEHQLLEGRASKYVVRPYTDPPLISSPPGTDDEEKTIDRLTFSVDRDAGMFSVAAVAGITWTDYYNEGNQYDGILFNDILLPGFGIPDAFRRIESEEQQNSLEFRIGSGSESPFFWVLGTNFYTSDRSNDQRDTYDNYRPTATTNADVDRAFETRTSAIFGEVTYPILEDLNITAGLRQTWEEKTYSAVWRASATNPSGIQYGTDSGVINDSYVTGRLGLSYAMTPNLNIYSMYARGHKTGGFQDYGTNPGLGQSDLPYQPADVDSYEVGFKFEGMDGRFRLNVAAFFNEVTDDHLLVFDPMTFAAVAENFDTETKGVEVEAYWRVLDSLTLNSAIAYTEAEITRVPASSASGASVGNPVPDSPEWNISFGVEHRAQLGADWDLTTRLSMQHVGERSADPQHSFDLDPYDIVDLRVGVGNSAWEFYVFGDNLLDEQYDLYGYYWPSFGFGGAETGTPSRGRIFGAGLQYDF